MLIFEDTNRMTRDLQKEMFIRMTTAPVGHLVTSLAVPSIVSMLVSGFLLALPLTVSTLKK